MNLHALVSGAIAVVNPFTPVTIRVSTGYTTGADGTRTPTYDDVIGISAQIQNLTFGDLAQIDGLNLQGDKRKIYLNGSYDGVNRESGVGGDLIVFPDGDSWPFGTSWLVAQTLEQWPDWCCVAVTQQIGVP